MTIDSLPVVSALWLGMLTSVSPCPLASNIAAVTYIGNRVARPVAVLCSGVAYTVGRIIVYAALGTLLSASVLEVPATARFLQTVVPRIVGPLLVVAGLLVLGLIPLWIPGRAMIGRWGRVLGDRGLAGALPLGMLFALAFCPVSAGLFFGSLVPLSVANEQPVLLPISYGIGTGLPVLVAALLLALGMRSLGAFLARVAVVELWLRRCTGVVLIGVGLYYCVTRTFGVVW